MFSMGKSLIGVRNCLHYQITHLSFISWQEVTFPRFYGGHVVGNDMLHVVGNDMLHLPRPTIKGKVEKYIYTSPELRFSLWYNAVFASAVVR